MCIYCLLRSTQLLGKRAANHQLVNFANWFPTSRFHVAEHDYINVLRPKMANQATDAGIDAFFLITDELAGLAIGARIQMRCALRNQDNARKLVMFCERLKILIQFTYHLHQKTPLPVNFV